MWQVDNDRYHLWRLEHELGPKQIDRLLDSVTASDRTEAPNLARLSVVPLAGAVRRLLKSLYSPFFSVAIVRRASE